MRGLWVKTENSSAVESPGRSVILPADETPSAPDEHQDLPNVPQPDRAILGGINHLRRQGKPLHMPDTRMLNSVVSQSKGRG